MAHPTHSLTHSLTHSPTTHSLTTTRKGDAGPVEAFLSTLDVDAQHEHHRVGLRGRRQSQAEERIRLALDVRSLAQSTFRPGVGRRQRLKGLEM